ncbi:MAG: hypothetical protein M0R33_02700 [Methylomonas sp.]|uniref:hypothetical protein n=1 Tax=Methylomonas sp. TaxID=418 RepID=UPI0025D5890A|nr:hypothetical protein [Methylomonas sp.]MCK9605341.1 hypothetical protein [Methylomonas sp.]
MNTIHSSSLTAYPAGFIKPEQDRFTQKPAGTDASDKQATDVPGRLEAPASTPEQIKTALATSGFNQQNNFSQSDDTRSNKALQAYNQTREQANQLRLENLITRVDYYA